MHGLLFNITSKLLVEPPRETQSTKIVNLLLVLPVIHILESTEVKRVTAQKIVRFIVTAVKTSNTT
jgi:cytochrome b